MSRGHHTKGSKLEWCKVAYHKVLVLSQVQWEKAGTLNDSVPTRILVVQPPLPPTPLLPGKGREGRKKSWGKRKGKERERGKETELWLGFGNVVFVGDLGKEIVGSQWAWATRPPPPRWTFDGGPSCLLFVVVVVVVVVVVRLSLVPLVAFGNQS